MKPKLLELSEKLTATDARLDEILSSETDLTAEAKAEHDKLVDERAKLTEAVAVEKDRLKREKERKALADAVAAEEAAALEESAKAEKAKELEAEKAKRREGSGRLTSASTELTTTEPNDSRRVLIPATVRRVQVKNFRGNRLGMEADERAFRFGMVMMAQLYATFPARYPHLRSCQDWVNRNMAAVGTNDASGYDVFVRPEFSSDIIDLREQFGVARRLFRREVMNSDIKTIPRREGGLTAYAVGENAIITESNKVWDDVTLTARKWGVISRASKEVTADMAISWGDDLAGEIAYAFSDKEDDAGFNGDATSTYHGIRGVRYKLQDVDNAGTDSAGLVTGAGNAYSELVLGDFNAVVGKLPQYADRPDTVWVCHRTFFYTVMEKLIQAAGGTTAMEMRSGDRRPRPLFLGYPVEFSQKFPSTEANSQVCAVLGSFVLGAAFGDRQQETVEFSDQAYVNGQSLWERDQIGIKGTERMDIVVHDVGSSSAAGPIVGLQTAAS